MCDFFLFLLLKCDGQRLRILHSPFLHVIHRMEFSIENHTDQQWIFRANFCGLSKLKFDTHFVSRRWCVKERKWDKRKNRDRGGEGVQLWNEQGKTRKGSTNYLFRLNINSHARKCHGFCWKVYMLEFKTSSTSMKCLKRLFWSNSINNQCQELPQYMHRRSHSPISHTHTSQPFSKKFIFCQLPSLNGSK